METVKEKKLVCLHRDDKYESEMKKKFAIAQRNILGALHLYEKLTNEKLQDSDFHRFLYHSDKLIADVIKAQTKTPFGLDRSKFLELVEVPDCTEVVMLLSENDFVHHSFFEYAGGKLEFAKAVMETINAKNIYCSPETAESYKKLQQIVKIGNELKEKGVDVANLFKIGNYNLISQVYETQLFRTCSPEEFLKFCRNIKLK